MARSLARFRVKVEWWDRERQKAVIVCNRILKTNHGADALVSKYVRKDPENYRGTIQFLGYEPRATREEQHARYIDCGPAAWDDR